MVASKANPFDFTLSKEDVLNQANMSLQSLQTSYLDIYYIHAPDHNAPIEDTLESMQQLYEGKIYNN